MFNGLGEPILPCLWPLDECVQLTVKYIQENNFF